MLSLALHKECKQPLRIIVKAQHIFSHHVLNELYILIHIPFIMSYTAYCL